MTQALPDLQKAAGATFTDHIPVSFGNDATVIETVTSGQLALTDRSHWGRVLVKGDDRIRFLHNQTTNDFNSLKPGQSCDTVFVTSTGRTIDLATAYVTEEAVLLLVSPGYNQRLMEWMDRFIFLADKVELVDLTPSTVTFSVFGQPPEDLGFSAIAPHTHQLINMGDLEVRVAQGNGLATPGYTLITDAKDAASLWQWLIDAGAQPFGSQVWEQLRIQQGRPMPGQELTEDINPLEAGLWHTISLSKGCYIGQETIARLHTYRGVKQQLWGIQLHSPATPDSPVMAGAEKIGTLTSCTPLPLSHPDLNHPDLNHLAQEYFGLAYIRTKSVTPGLKVKIGEVEGELMALPFVSHEYL